MKQIALIIGAICFFITGQSQDIIKARKILDTLTSPYFWGRGYTNNGMQKAAGFIAAEFKSYGLQSFITKGFLQEFTYPVNTFPGKMEVSVNGKVLQPGIDFIIGPESVGKKGVGVLMEQDSVNSIDREKKIIVSLENKLTWKASVKTEDYTLIQINKKSITEKPKTITLNIENKFIRAFRAANVCGYVQGTAHPDSFIVITAHYDHLGGMGSGTYFPGANDNASGVALLLALANHYAALPASYSVAFIAFGGEEAGLEGSKYFSENPLFPLKKIRFLINLDLIGTGEEGITSVNATVFKEEFALLNEINDREKYLVKIKPRGKAANSDHYWFTEKGVPSFFIYAMGGIQAYHDVYDRAATLPLTEFEDLFRLLVEFNKGLME